jgi:hypothetical protein
MMKMAGDRKTGGRRGGGLSWVDVGVGEKLMEGWRCVEKRWRLVIEGVAERREGRRRIRWRRMTMDKAQREKKKMEKRFREVKATKTEEGVIEEGLSSYIGTVLIAGSGKGRSDGRRGRKERGWRADGRTGTKKSSESRCQARLLSVRRSMQRDPRKSKVRRRHVVGQFPTLLTGRMRYAGEHGRWGR